MYTNELLEEKYKAQKKLCTEASSNNKDYIEFVEYKVKSLFIENSWHLVFSKRKGGYLKSKNKLT